MNKKFIWLIVSCLMVAALVLASCAPAVVEEKKATVVTKEPEKKVEEVVEEKPAVGEPQYGGEMILELPQTQFGFDDYHIGYHVCVSLMNTNERLWEGDWTKGPEGTGEYGMMNPAWPGVDKHVGCLAESWEIPDPNTFIIHVRPGVCWHDKPPVNGRELTAEDVAFTLEYYFDKDKAPFGHLRSLREGIESIEVIDNLTVKVTAPPTTKISALYMMYIFTLSSIRPPELYADGGDMTEWQNNCGTGPFMLTNFTPDVAVTLSRNPNYWKSDPFRPENKLPYLDTLKFIFIQDKAVLESAVATGKLDRNRWVSVERGNTLLRHSPWLKYVRYMEHHVAMLAPRHDVEPFGDVRIRRAMMLAIDHQGIVKDIYDGDAEFFNYMVMPLPEFAHIYTPYDEVPEDVRILYEYHPDMARDLLAEAGYPDGLEIEVITEQRLVEELELMAAYLKDVGIVLNITVLESGAYQAYRTGVPKTYKNAIFATHGCAVPYRLAQWRDGGSQNWTNINLPGVEDAVEYIFDNWWEPEKRNAKVKEIVLTEKREAWKITMPTEYSYSMWSPWIKGFSGEWCCGNQARDSFAKYVWCDQALKKQLIGR